MFYQGKFILRPLFLPRRRLSFHCVPTWPIVVCKEKERKIDIPSCKDTISVRARPIFVNTFNLNYFLRGFNSNIATQWVRAPPWMFWEIKHLVHNNGSHFNSFCESSDALILTWDKGNTGKWNYRYFIYK